jgi:hypothetical protein
MKSIKVLLSGITIILLAIFILVMTANETGENATLSVAICAIGIIVYVVGLIIPHESDNEIDDNTDDDEIN